MEIKRTWSIIPCEQQPDLTIHIYNLTRLSSHSVPVILELKRQTQEGHKFKTIKKKKKHILRPCVKNKKCTNILFQFYTTKFFIIILHASQVPLLELPGSWTTLSIWTEHFLSNDSSSNAKIGAWITRRQKSACDSPGRWTQPIQPLRSWDQPASRLSK